MELPHPISRRHAAALFAATLVLGFLAEFTIMTLFFPNEREKVRMAVLDSGTLTLTLAPLLYLLAFRPLLREVATRKQAESKAKEARAEAERANQAKDLFLATLSHELRTPLSSILLRSEYLLRSNPGTEACKRAAESIASNARIQARLIEDLLDVSRIRSGKLRLEKQKVNLGQVIQEALDSVLPNGREKGIEVNVSLDPSAPAIEVDPRRVQQIVWNLLSNALKFTDAGGQVAIRTIRKGNWVDIRVSDTGIGISSEFMPRIFALFSQADTAMTRAKGGLGLGLALVRQLTELHGGHVAAESAGRGEGAVFTVSLPLPSAGAPHLGAIDGEEVSREGEDAADAQDAPRLEDLPHPCHR